MSIDKTASLLQDDRDALYKRATVENAMHGQAQHLLFQELEHYQRLTNRPPSAKVLLVLKAFAEDADDLAASPPSPREPYEVPALPGPTDLPRPA